MTPKSKKCNFFLHNSFKKYISKRNDMTTLKKPLLFSEIKVEKNQTIKTGVKKFDTWFSRLGGMVLKSIVFVTGDSGAGKTTLMMNIMKWLPNTKSAFYERESTLDEVKGQIAPLTLDDNALLMDYTTHPHFEDFMATLEAEKPQIVIVDSLQAIAKEDYADINEDKAIDTMRIRLSRYTKENNAVLFIIGHNTKEGEFAGKNTNMQMVDAHMVLNYDKKSNVRVISWGQKNRKGPMGSMYYEIQNGEIVFFNNDEYKLPEVEVKLEASKFISFSKEVSEVIKTLLKEYQSRPNYSKFIVDYNNSMKELKTYIGKDKTKEMVESIRVISILINRYGYN